MSAKNQQADRKKAGCARAVDALRLRRQAALSGLPVFAMRMAAAQKLVLAEEVQTVRFRHD